MNKAKTFQCSDEIMEEAYGWVLAFNGDTPASKQEIATLNEWVKRSPAHAKALKEAEQFWCEAEVLSALAVPQPKEKASRSGNIFKFFASLFPLSGGAGGMALGRRSAFASLGFIGLAVALIWGLSPFSGTVGNGLYQTAVGEQITLRLKDDSRVLLDTNSAVRIAYEQGARKITLVRGKAHFKVAKNPQRPFEVYAREGLVRAVGTAFSVYLARKDIEVLVDEGRVDLARLEVDNPGLTQGGDNNASPASETASSSGAPPGSDVAPRDTASEQVFLSLDKGQQASFDRQRQSTAQLSDRELEDALAWRNGVLVFERDALSEVVFEVGRYTDTRIDVIDPELQNMALGGRFRVGEIDALFEVLQVGFGVEVRYLGEKHVQLSLASTR